MSKRKLAPVTDLSFATLDELIGELERRTIGFAVAMEMPPKNGKAGNELMTAWAGSSVAHVTGLSVFLAHKAGEAMEGASYRREES